MAAKDQKPIRCSGPMKARIREIATRANASERYVLDRLIEHYGDAIEAMLTTPVRVEPRAATGGR